MRRVLVLFAMVCALGCDVPSRWHVEDGWVRDPDGYEWEVFVVLEDNLPETAPCECGDNAPAQNELASSCCGVEATRSMKTAAAICCT